MNIRVKKFKKLILQSRYSESIFLILIFIVSFLIRYIGLKFSYPLLTHTDEFVVIEPVIGMTQNNSLNPNAFYRPDQILYFLNFIYLNLISFIQTGKNLTYSIQFNQYSYFFYSRILIAFLGSLIPLVAFKIGKESDPDFSIPGALIFAFFPAFVFHSHYITPDIPITFFLLLIILFCIRYIKYLNIKYIYLATFICAINTAEKYPGLLSFGIIIISIILVEIRTNPQIKIAQIRNILFQSGKLFLVFFISLYLVAPNLFIEYGQVIKFIINETRTTHLGADNLGWLGNAKFYATEFKNQSNILVSLFAAIGILGLIKERNNIYLLFFFGFVYWIILSKLPLHWERWALPMYTSPLLFSALGYKYLQNLIINHKFYRLIISSLFYISVIWLFIFSFSRSVRMTFTDTRVLALEYCQSAGINPENSIYENYTPFSPALRTGNFQYMSNENESKKYIILSSYMFGRYYGEAERYFEQINFYEKIKLDNKLIKKFEAPQPKNRLLAQLDDMIYYIRRISGHYLPDRITGPTIIIYEVNKL